MFFIFVSFLFGLTRKIGTLRTNFVEILEKWLRAHLIMAIMLKKIASIFDGKITIII